MRQRFGVVDPAVVDNGVDIDYFATADRSVADPKRILFLGSLDWHPNLDSIDILLGDIMPKVVAAEPGARLSIVGRNPPPALVKRVEADPNAELHANVPDVRPYLAGAGMLAVPLRIGGGSRLKILEAAAAGLPVVSTRIGAEGLVFTAGRDLVVVEDEGRMAAAIVESIRHPERAAAMARSGRAVIESHYGWRRLADRLETVWERTRTAQPTPATA